MVSGLVIRMRHRVLLLLALATVVSVANAADVGNLRLWPAPDSTRLVLDLSANVDHTVFQLHQPERVVIDLKNSTLSANTGDLLLAASGISAVRYAAKDGIHLRIVLDLEVVMQIKTFVLPPNDQYGHRLVVDLFRQTSTNEVSVSAPASGPAKQSKATSDLSKGTRELIIAIDAGHGGEDPGAIGPAKTREKHIVLAIAKELETAINRERGFKAVLIRSGDYYISLQQRRDLARKHQADLFVSIHADAFTHPAANGASVYALSQKSATSATARYLADRENATDIIGGVGGISLENKDDVLRSVLVGMSMEYSLNASIQVGDKILVPLGAVTKLHKSSVEQAGFAVLKSPDIPSILVETGFISNPAEERNLGSPNYRRNLANAIASGIKDYFYSNPTPGTWLAENRTGSILSYTVARGDTLSQIAARYRISVTQIRALNGLSSSSIRVGQVLKIPGAS